MGKLGTAVAERPTDGAGADDHRLVGAVRRGDDRAFELLYERYEPRITAYVAGMVKDRGRAEDITQEVFVSALRRMRATERPIAFKPWIYEIARNACIDAYRRGRRAEEVSFDADDRLLPSDHGRLVATQLQPDAAVDVKVELDNLRGAFGGLSDAHHQILVMRELEGRSYKDIGERMGMSGPAVESTLFRARKRLGEEFAELASGARCRWACALIATGQAPSRQRDERRFARHVAHCQPCRRFALQAGFDLPATVPLRRRIAALLPFPVLLRWRRAGGDWAASIPSVAEGGGSGWGKLAAGLAALALAGAGATVGDRADAQRAAPAADRPAERAAAPSARARAAAETVIAARGERAAARTAVVRAGGRSGRTRTTAGGGGGSSGGDRGAGKPVSGADPATRPADAAPVAPPDVKKTIDDATAPVQQTVDDTVQNTQQTVENTVQQTQQTVDTTIQQTQQTVQETTDTVTDAVAPVTDAAGDLLDP